MRRSSCLAGLLGAIAMACAGSPLPVSAQPGEKAVRLDQLLASVQAGLAKAQKALAFEKMPLLKSVALTVSAVAKNEGGGKISLWVLSVGAKRDATRSQEVEITLTPPGPTEPAKVSAEESAVTEQLAAAIIGAARSAKDSRKDKDVPLVFSGLKVTLGFVVNTEGSGGAKFEILPVGFDLSGSAAQSAGHKIVVTYEDAEKK